MMKLSPDVEQLIDALIDVGAERIKGYMEATGQLASARAYIEKMGVSPEMLDVPEVYAQLIAIRIMQRLRDKSPRAARLALHKILDAMGAFDPTTIGTERVTH